MARLSGFIKRSQRRRDACDGVRDEPGREHCEMTVILVLESPSVGCPKGKCQIGPR